MIKRLLCFVVVGMLVVGCGEDGGGNPGGNSNRNDSTNSNRNDSTVSIGGNIWMKYNLNVETEDSWCYNHNSANCAKYGRLYTWKSAKSACAGLGGGWRLPTNDDWDALVTAAGGRETAGTKLKSSTGWEEQGVYAPVGTDIYGFSALPGGYRSPDDTFDWVGYVGYWWTATEFSATSDVYYRGISTRVEIVGSSWEDPRLAFSVRCVK